MTLKWRKWNKALHRDLGYVFFAMTVIYSVSGIAVNHLRDWNPSYHITLLEVRFNGPAEREEIDKEMIRHFVQGLGEDTYKKHYFPTQHQLKIFIDNGSIVVDLNSGIGYLEKLERRPLLHAFNYLHYNPGRWWTLFSDIFAVALILMAGTGLFILTGKNGISRRGAILAASGAILPALYLIFFYR